MSPQERAAYIKGEMRRLDVRQYAVARALGVSDAAVNRVINGNRGSARLAKAIAEVIGHPVDRLFPEVAARETQKAISSGKTTDKEKASPIDLDALHMLRKEVKKLMIDLDLDVRKRGALAIHAAAVSERIGKNVTRPILSMALSGYRASTHSKTILEALRSILTEKLITSV